MQDNSSHRPIDPNRQFAQALVLSVDLGAGEAALPGIQAQLLQQHVSGSGRQYPELIGEEPRAIGAVDVHTFQKFLR